MTATNWDIEAALLAGQKRHDVADSLGASYRRVCEVAQRLGLPPSGWRNRRGIHPARVREVVEAYADLGTMEKVGAVLGISRQRVEQLIVHHEQTTGQRLPRSLPHTKPRVETFCARCGGLIGKLTARVAETHSGYCGRCTRFAGPFAISDAQVEEWVAAIKAGARWFHLTTAKGWAANESHRIPLAVYKRLYSDGRHDEIAQLWPRGVPAWIINRTQPRRVPTVHIPHEGIVNEADKKVR